MHSQLNPRNCNKLVTLLALKLLPETLLSAAVDLDQSALGGLWTAEGYQQECLRPSSDLLGIWPLQDDRLKGKGLQPVPSQNSRPTPQLPLFGMGCGWSILDETHIIMLAVHPNLCRRGLGSAILLGLLTYACDRDSNYATLEVRASNRAAIALYESLGFKTAGRRPKYYTEGDISEDALILWRAGLQSAEFRAQMAQHWKALEPRWAAWNWQIISPFQNYSEME
jgi:[ribosomal protein S18]-alanine N-acetyltransferase